MTTTQTLPQAYVLPLPFGDGWGLICYGLSTIPDDTIIPLPLTEQASYAQALEFTEGLDLDERIEIDGWRTWAELMSLEPDLAERMRPTSCPTTFDGATGSRS